MNFLEAHRIVANFGGGPPLPFLLGISGAADKLDVFVKAAAALRGRSSRARTLAFNTLGQTLQSNSVIGEREVFVLFPWDLVPEADWRSGITAAPLDYNLLQARATDTAEKLVRRRDARLLYVSAPLPPLFAHSALTARLASWLSLLMVESGAEILPPKAFSLASYMSVGSPIASTALSLIASKAVELAATDSSEPKKVLITDLDNVMWRGVIAEDGLDGIHFLAEGAGFKHHLYQTFVLKLRREGALICAVSRNDSELAHGPFQSGRMPLRTEDFVVILASYNAKSSQIKEIARQLNLGLDSFVFVDDNPIEIEEVSAAIPELKTVQFPVSDDSFTDFLSDLAALFSREVITPEDSDRTALYRRGFEGMLPAVAEGSDLTGFLRGLEMSLTIHDRSRGDRSRAVQLINKTNQFNLNGRRVTDEEVDGILAGGGSLFTCSLSDRTGSHGEILSCLTDSAGLIRSLVMSCRVFQRRVEHAFFSWLGTTSIPPTSLAFAPTNRNEPMQDFLKDPSFAKTETETIVVDLKRFARTHEQDLSLFAISEPTGSSLDGVSHPSA